MKELNCEVDDNNIQGEMSEGKYIRFVPLFVKMDKDEYKELVELMGDTNKLKVSIKKAVDLQSN